jgi:hypothetical protein
MGALAMSREPSELRQFSYREPILPESLDNATAFFYAVYQLISSTPSEISATLAFNRKGFAARLLHRLATRIGAIGWIRGRGVAAPNSSKG